MKRILSTVSLFLFVTACATSTEDPNRQTKKGAVIGAVAGGVAGAVIGNQSGKDGEGAAIGAVVGAGVGAAIGRMMDKQQKELEQIEGVEVTRNDEDELEVAVSNEILFDFDSSALSVDSLNTLGELSSVFARYPDTAILVEGHADSKGSDDYNLRLSERRARTVRDYFVGHRVEAFRMEYRGYGESMPRASNDTESGRQLNRRVEIQVKAIAN